MYESFYGMHSKPFTIIPNPGIVFESKRHYQALTYLRYALADDIGFVLLTGEIGTGKTTLLRRFLAEDVNQNIDVAVVFNTNVDGLELLQLILQDFDVTPLPATKAECLNALNDHLIANFAAGKRSLLVVDEAQNLSRAALEEVRLLSNLQSDSQSLLQIILCGQPELQTITTAPGLEQLAQRIAVNYHLKPLTREEVGHYIQYRLQQAGAGNLNIFDDPAIDLIYSHTGGTPRSINILCNAALVYGFADELPIISRDIVEQVIADNGGLIAASITPTASATPVVEHASTPPAGLAFSLQPDFTGLQNEVRRLGDRVAWLESQKNAGNGDNARLLEAIQALLEQERKRNLELQQRCLTLENTLQQKDRALSSQSSEKENVQENSGIQPASPQQTTKNVTAGLPDTMPLPKSTSSSLLSKLRTFRNL